MTQAKPPARPAAVGANRRPRQSPTDLTLTFADEATVRRQSKLLEEPGWLLDERLAALARFAELPIESNRLYTTYVDLRNAHLTDARPAGEAPRQVPTAGSDNLAHIPDGSAGLIELDEGPLVSSTLVGNRLPGDVYDIGQAVEVVYEDHPAEGFSLPRFRIVE